MTQASPYSQDDRIRWKNALLRKGQEVASLLEDVLAKKDVKLDELQLIQKADKNEPDDKRLRRFLDLLMLKMRSVEDPKFGWDEKSQSFYPKAALNERPWLD